MVCAVPRIVHLIAIDMAEAVGFTGRHFGRCLVSGMTAEAFVVVVTLMPSVFLSYLWRTRCLMHLLRSHADRHGVASPAAQRQQDHHESEHK